MLFRLVLALAALGLLVPVRVLLPSASAQTTTEVKSNNQKITTKAAKEISAVIARQQASWNKGDLMGFLSYYAHTKSVAYVSNGGAHKGFDAIEKQYRSHYGHDRKTMGQLYLTELEITELGDKHALAIGKFTVVHHSSVPIYGRFSLIFERTKEGWKIIYDHSSA